MRYGLAEEIVLHVNMNDLPPSGISPLYLVTVLHRKLPGLCESMRIHANPSKAGAARPRTLGLSS